MPSSSDVYVYGPFDVDALARALPDANLVVRGRPADEDNGVTQVTGNVDRPTLIKTLLELPKSGHVEIYLGPPRHDGWEHPIVDVDEIGTDDTPWYLRTVGVVIVAATAGGTAALLIQLASKI